MTRKERKEKWKKIMLEKMKQEEREKRKERKLNLLNEAVAIGHYSVRNEAAITAAYEDYKSSTVWD